MLHSGEDDWGASESFRRDVMRLLGDVGTIQALKTIGEWQELVHNMQHLRDNGAVIVLPSGDELELIPSELRDHIMNEAERAEESANEAYYGGDSPGSYGPDDPRFK